MIGPIRAYRERAYLIDRYATARGRWPYRPGRDTGISSDALVSFAFTGKGPHDQPYDHDDLGRCERAYAKAPKHLQRRMLPVLDHWRVEVWAKYPDGPRVTYPEYADYEEVRACPYCWPEEAEVHLDENFEGRCDKCGSLVTFEGPDESEDEPSLAPGDPDSLHDTHGEKKGER